jgi:hypothetical protein
VSCYGCGLAIDQPAFYYLSQHPIKSNQTDTIVPVEPGEAEWNLQVLEALFDFCCVQPAIAKKRKDDQNQKLIEAGKLPIP